MGKTFRFADEKKIVPFRHPSLKLRCRKSIIFLYISRLVSTRGKLPRIFVGKTVLMTSFEHFSINEKILQSDYDQ